MFSLRQMGQSEGLLSIDQSEGLLSGEKKFAWGSRTILGDILTLRDIYNAVISDEKVWMPLE